MNTEKSDPGSETLTGSMLAEKALQALNEGWGYIWGTKGKIWTEADQRAATREQTVKYGSRWIGKRVCDCSGLVVWAAKECGLSLHHGSNSQYSDDSIRRGALKNGIRADGKELKTGSLVFRTKNGSRHHVGIYTGGGIVAEAKGTAYGVIRSDTGAFDDWSELKGVDCSAPERPAAWAEVRKGSKGIAVQEMQRRLTGLGFPCGALDGICGEKTLAALLAFQQDRGLSPDGICGNRTWAALAEREENGGERKTGLSPDEGAPSVIPENGPPSGMLDLIKGLLARLFSALKEKIIPDERSKTA